VRVLLADDHVLVRAGLRRVLESFPGVEVVAEADDGDQVPDLVAVHRPDAVVTDLSMARHSGYAVLTALRQQYPEVKVLVVSMHSDAMHVRQALEAGACAYIVKDGAPTELEVALRAAQNGQTFLSPKVARTQLTDRRGRHGEGDGPASLSPRQAEILDMLGRGLVTKEIASRLGISVKTVETHRTRLMQVLKLRRATELLRYAVLHSAAAT
jgi:DNA-binding NarL/FixJ family response regulator